MPSNDPAIRSTAPRPLLWTVIWTALLILGLAGWITLAYSGDADRAWRAMLICFVYFTPMAAGMVVWPAVVIAARGQWMGPARRVATAAIAFAPVSILSFIALWLGKSYWAAWLHEPDLHNRAWLDPAFLFPRDLAGLVIFWSLAAWFALRVRRGERPKVLAGFVVFTYTIVFSLLGMDLVMSLDPHWFSTLFGGYFFISGMYIAVAAWTFILLATRRATEPRRRSDLGKLIVAFSLLTTYLMYSQLIVIWYENLPDEVTYVIPRLTITQWPDVSAALLGTVYLGPLVLLLTRWAKGSPTYLRVIALLVLAGMWVERWWLVTPTLGGHVSIGWPEVTIAAAFAGALALSIRPLLGREEDDLQEAPAVE